MRLPPRSPSSAVMTCVDPQSAMRPPKCLGGESREHDRVHGTEPRTGEHGDGDLGNHRQIDGDPVALAHAERLQGIGALADALVQLAIAQAFGLPPDRPTSQMMAVLSPRCSR